MSIGTRAFTLVQFGPADEVVTIPIPQGGAKGRVAVYARLTGTGGAASVRVYGSFDSAPTSSSSNEVQTLDLGDINAPDSTTYSNVMLPEVPSLGRWVSGYSTVVIPGVYEILRNVVGYSSAMFPTAIGGTQTGLPPSDDDEWMTITNHALGFEPGQPPPDDEFFTQTNYALGMEPGTLPPEDLEFNTQSLTIPSSATFKLTFNAHQTAAIAWSIDMSAAIQAALVALVDFDPGDVVVAKVSDTVYTVTFGGAYANQNAGAITITSQTGFTATGVTETQAGSTDTEDLTDSATLGNPITEIVSGQEALFPYITLVFGGDADPGLLAEVYVVSF